MRKRGKNAAPGMKRGLINALQNLAIVLLVVLGLGLSAAGGLLPLDEMLSGLRSRVEPEETGAGYAAAASPFCIVITPQEGAHCAVMYDGAELDEAYSRFSSTLGEALGSSRDVSAVSEEAWRDALSGRGVYFDFYNDFLLSTYSIWLGTAMTGEASGHTARRVCLALEDGEVALYYIRARASGGQAFYRCATALPADALSALLESAMPNGAEFNFERGDSFSRVDPYFVLTADSPQVYAASSYNSLQELGTDAAMSAFGMNSYLAQNYPEADGTLVWVDGEATLRLGPDGTVHYSSRQPERGEEPRMGPATAIEYGRSIVEATLGQVSGDAELQLSFIYFDEGTEEQPGTEAYQLRFNYVLNGLPVELSGFESAAEIRFVGGTVYYAEMVFRSFVRGNSLEDVLPSDMVASIVQSEGGGEPRLSYIDTAEGVSVRWPIK